MPTEKTRLMFVVDDGVAEAIEHYRLLNNFKSTSKAVLELVLKGLSGFNDSPMKPSVFSGDEIKLISLFRNLSDSGRNEVFKAAVFSPKEPSRNFVFDPIPDEASHVIDTRVLDCFLKAFPRMSPADQSAFLFEILEKAKMLKDDDCSKLLNEIGHDLASARAITSEIEHHDQKESV